MRAFAARGGLPDVVHVHYARAAEDMIFGEELHALALDHPDAELVHHQHRALDVDGQHVVDRLLGHLAPRVLARGHVADVVDERVDVAGLVGHPLDLVPARDVALYELRRQEWSA